MGKVGEARVAAGGDEWCPLRYMRNARSRQPMAFESNQLDIGEELYWSAFLVASAVYLKSRDHLYLNGCQSTR